MERAGCPAEGGGPSHSSPCPYKPTVARETPQRPSLGGQISGFQCGCMNKMKEKYARTRRPPPRSLLSVSLRSRLASAHDSHHSPRYSAVAVPLGSQAGLNTALQDLSTPHRRWYRSRIMFTARHFARSITRMSAKYCTESTHTRKANHPLYCCSAATSMHDTKRSGRCHHAP